jgi:hypothetical protein
MNRNSKVQERMKAKGFVFALRQPRKAKDLTLAILATWRFKNRQLAESG